MRRAGIQRRGFALADFLTGTMIFAGALVGFSALTKSKFDVIHQAGAEQVAQGHLEAALDAVRRDGLTGKPNLKKVDRDGFLSVAERTLSLRGLGKVSETLAVRPLLSFDPQGQRLIETEVYEVRVQLSWAEGQRSLSSLIPRRAK